MKAITCHIWWNRQYIVSSFCTSGTHKGNRLEAIAIEFPSLLCALGSEVQLLDLPGEIKNGARNSEDAVHSVSLSDLRSLGNRT